MFVLDVWLCIGFAVSLFYYHVRVYSCVKCGCRGSRSHVPAALAASVDFDVLRYRLRYVYKTYLREQFPDETSLLDVSFDRQAFSDVRHRACLDVRAVVIMFVVAVFQTVPGSVSLAEGFDIWILMNELCQMIESVRKEVCACFVSFSCSHNALFPLLRAGHELSFYR